MISHIAQFNTSQRMNNERHTFIHAFSNKCLDIYPLLLAVNALLIAETWSHADKQTVH